MKSPLWMSRYKSSWFYTNHWMVLRVGLNFHDFARHPALFSPARPWTGDSVCYHKNVNVYVTYQCNNWIWHNWHHIADRADDLRFTGPPRESLFEEHSSQMTTTISYSRLCFKSLRLMACINRYAGADVSLYYPHSPCFALRSSWPPCRKTWYAKCICTEVASRKNAWC